MNRPYGKKFLEMYDGEVPWFTYSRFDSLDKEIVDMMANKGCKYLFMGSEHFSEEILNYFEKTKDPKKYIEKFWDVLKILKDYDIIPILSILIGSPKETRDTLESLYQNLLKAKKINPKVEFELSPLTLEIGTGLWEEYKEGKVKLYPTKDITLMREYSGVQAFIDKHQYEDVIITPQKFLFKNESMPEIEFESLIKEYVAKIEKLRKY